MDVELRLAERSGDRERLITVRKRAGLCPGCGSTPHEGVRLRAFLEGDAERWEVLPAAGAPAADGYWRWANGGSNYVSIVDPCGRQVIWDGVGVERANEEFPRVVARHEAGLLGQWCRLCSERPADFHAPDWVWRHARGHHIEVPDPPGEVCKQCYEEIEESRLRNLSDFEANHEIEIEDFYDEGPYDDS